MSNPFANPPQPPIGGFGGSSGGGGRRKDKIAAALLAIFLGSLGIHKFYLGGQSQKTAGIVMLVISIVGFCFLFIGPLVIGIIAFIEGIIYLTKDDAEFDATYGHGDKAWF
jgi:TM2 domain-containing membrane protein YozV